jgi:hypothetical protein
LRHTRALTIEPIRIGASNDALARPRRIGARTLVARADITRIVIIVGLARARRCDDSDARRFGVTRGSGRVDVDRAVPHPDSGADSELARGRHRGERWT